MIKIVVRDKPNTFDRYTVIIHRDDEIEFYAMSINPNSPQGFNQYIDTMKKGDKNPKYKDADYLGKKVPWSSLEPQIKKAIMRRLSDD